jgi:hypothetical protein
MLIDNKQFFDLLGVRYLLASADPGDRPQLLPDHEGKGEPGRHPGWARVGRDEAPAAYSFLKGGVVSLSPHDIYENTEVFPRAFVVPRAEGLPPEQKVFAALRSADLRRTVFLADWGGPAAEGPAGDFRPARVVEQRPNRVVVRVDAGPSGYLVLADVWYPGWRCSVDGQPAPLYRADYLFRATPLTEGEHTVAFTFEPESYRRGQMISGAAMAVVVGLLLLGWVRMRVRQRMPLAAESRQG